MTREQTLAYNETMIAEFRANKGRLQSFGDAPVLLLTTTGAKSGQQRTSPMMYLRDDTDPARVHVFASAAGADTNPAWFHNLVAHPDAVTVEIGESTFVATAEVLTDPERERVYAVQAERYPGFAEYQTKTTRLIPVITLTLQPAED